RIPTLWWIIASGAMVNFNFYVLGTFLPAFLIRYHGLSVAQAGLWAGLGHGVSGVIGGASAGFIGDWAIHHRQNGRMLVAGSAALLAAPAAFFGIRVPAGSVVPAVLLLMLCYGLMNMYYGNTYSALQDIVSPSL